MACTEQHPDDGLSDPDRWNVAWRPRSAEMRLLVARFRPGSSYVTICQRLTPRANWLSFAAFYHHGLLRFAFTGHWPLFRATGHWPLFRATRRLPLFRATRRLPLFQATLGPGAGLSWKSPIRMMMGRRRLAPSLAPQTASAGTQPWLPY